jgi:uncharacterized protein
MKLLILIALGFVIYSVLKSYSRSQQLGNRSRNDQHGGRGPEDMVKCAYCGVNLPRSEAFLSRGDFFCSREHQQLKQN